MGASKRTERIRVGGRSFGIVRTARGLSFIRYGLWLVAGLARVRLCRRRGCGYFHYPALGALPCDLATLQPRAGHVACVRAVRRTFQHGAVRQSVFLNKEYLDVLELRDGARRLWLRSCARGSGRLVPRFYPLSLRSALCLPVSVPGHPSLHAALSHPRSLSPSLPRTPHHPRARGSVASSLAGLLSFACAMNLPDINVGKLA